METTILEETWTPSNTESKYKPEKLARYKFSGNFNQKTTEALDIIDNKAGEKIYEDLHLQVYVKSEAIVKDYINDFTLNNLGGFYDNIQFGIYNPSVKNPNDVPIWTSGVTYKANTLVKKSSYLNSYNYFICVKEHKSDSSNEPDLFSFDSTYWEYFSFESIYSNWIRISKNVSQSNYKSNWPYVGELVFKNLWGCDLANELNLFTKKGNILIQYPSSLAKNLANKTSNYNKFYSWGYFDSTYQENQENGVSLIMGESLDNDDILGNSKNNNYLTISSNRHNVPSNWNSLTDSVISNYFGGEISNPFDHYYFLSSNLGIPFFKEKTFNDAYIRLVLDRVDILGNKFKRIVNLPITITFTNNLIKGYFAKNSVYILEFLNSGNINRFIGKKGSNILCTTEFWCPDVSKLTFSSTILGCTIKDKPKISNENGQLCRFSWSFNAINEEDHVVLATHSFKYSDGINNDEFIYIERITIKG